MATLTGKVALLWCLISLVPVTLAQSVELVCDVSVQYATVNDETGQLVFASFPPDYEVASEVEYDPGALGPWYNFAEGIINIVRPGSVTEDVIVPVLGVTVNISTSSGVESVEASELLSDVVQWMSGIIAFVVLGGLIAISFLVCGCVFCSCRVCCKNCGGDLKQKESEYTNCLTITFTVILILFTCGLIVGVIFAFLTNQQVFNVISEAEETVNASLADVEGFLDDGLVKVDSILCTFNQTVDVGVEEAEGVVTMLNESVEMFSGEVTGLINTAVNVSEGIDQALDTLEAVNGNVSTLQNMTNALNESLNEVADDIDELINQCMTTTPMPDCDTVVDSDAFRNALLADFNDVPDIQNVTANVQDVLTGENLTMLAEQGMEVFENYTTVLMDSANTSINDIVTSINDIRDNVTSIRSTVLDFSDEIEGSDGIIVQVQNFSNDAFDFVRQVDMARYVLGLFICSLAAIVVVVVLLGVVCGIVGFRTDRAPYERTTLSNCGAYTLLCSVALAVFFGAFLMTLSALVFFTGSISFKFCEDMAGPEYVLFVETIDNPDVVGGEYVLSSIAYGNGSIPLTVSGILNNCSDNATVYVALQLDNILDLNELTNINEQFPNLTTEIAEITADQQINASDFISDEVRERLESFNDSGIAEINITQYQEQINAGIINQTFLDEQLAALQNLSAAFAMANRQDLVNDTESIIMQIVMINASVPAIEAQVDMLAVAVDQLNVDANDLTASVDRLLNETDFLVDQINNVFIGNLTDIVLNAYGEIEEYVDDFVDYVISSVENEVANCYPLFAIYTGFYNTICETAVNSLNGFWLALGWCAIFFIPVAIFAIITSQYYRRMKYDEDVAIPYDDSFPLKTY